MTYVRGVRACIGQAGGDEEIAALVSACPGEATGRRLDEGETLVMAVLSRTERTLSKGALAVIGAAGEEELLARDEAGQTALHYACADGDVRSARALVERQPELLEMPDEEMVSQGGLAGVLLRADACRAGLPPALVCGHGADRGAGAAAREGRPA